MEITETVLVRTPEEWRAWLEANHQTKTEIWMIRFKKKSGKPSIDYTGAVEEGLCFGWIDSLEKGIDDESYALRWTPRRPRSSWTETNRDRVRALHGAGRMAPAGLAILPADLRTELGV
jgi:uncharacterized protein YdeI (YjbR/CyaY-like superfamily)